MDYEQEYNASLEQARKELKACGTLDCDAAKLIFRLFPQLHKEEKPLTPFQQCLNCILRGVYYAEVPDEKVNEFILNVVRTRTDELIKLAKKQEEQKHPDGCFTCDEYKKGYEAGRLNGFTAGYNKAMKEVEQKEQKPEGWSDTNELVFKDICKHLKEEGYNGWIVLLEALRNGEFQSKQEWSEDDEKTIDTIVSVLGQYIDYKAGSGTSSGFAFATPRYSKEIDWLKSLRPSWKPSGEQMMALRRAVNKLSNSDVADSVRLSIMHDNLKKLM